MNKKGLLKIIGEAQAKLSKINNAESLAKNRALIGKCFKYPRNCYSLPQTAADYWPVYKRVVSGDEGGCRAFQFETDSDGKISIETHAWLHETGCVPITELEFQKAWNVVQNRIAKLNP